MIDDDDDETLEAGTPPLDNDQVGTIGQEAFSLWCSQAQITATPPAKDKFGWDYHLQWDREGAAFDPPDVSCSVQVKTTAKGAETAAIKLSNWRRMALGHAPWFVVAIGLDDREIASVHVVPVDEALIVRTVKRLHRLKASAAEHEAKMIVRWTEQHRLHKPEYASLLAALTAHMGHSEEEYRQKKRGWIASAQNEARRIEGSISIDAASEEEFHRLLARFAVRLDESLPIKDFKTAVSKTAGAPAIPPALTELSGGTITLKDRRPDAVSTMVLFDRDRADTVQLTLDTYASGCVFQFLPVERQILRFVSPLLSFVWYPPEGDRTVFTTHFEVPWGGTFSLMVLARACRAARMFAQARTRGLLATLESDILTGPLSLDLSAAPEAIFDPEFLDTARAVEDAGALARYFDLALDTIDISIAELVKRRFSIRTFAAAIDRSIGQIGLRAVMTPDEPVAGKKSALIVVAVVPLGKHVVAGVFSLGGIADWRDGPKPGTGTMGIENAEAKLRIKKLVPRDQWDGQQLEASVEALVPILEAEGYEVIVRSGRK